VSVITMHEKTSHEDDNMKAELTVLIINYNTSKFIDIVLYALERLTKSHFEVLICDNGSTDKDILNLCQCVAQYENVSLIFRKQSSKGSIGHGEAMDLLTEKVNTPYFVTHDSDCVFLQKGWDEILINNLGDRCKCIGTPPVPNSTKATDFPSLYAVLYETETYRKLSSPSFSPDPVWILSDNKQNVPSRDTGWEVREKFLENGYTGICMEVKNTRYYKKGPFNDIICAEYYLPESKKIFACHFGRGATLGTNKYKDIAFGRIPLIGDYYARKKGIDEQKKWIEKVRKIVNCEPNYDET
jgi:glycosyltransferase involved in cell wall biosynthesis